MSLAYIYTGDATNISKDGVDYYIKDADFEKVCKSILTPEEFYKVSSWKQQVDFQYKHYVHGMKRKNDTREDYLMFLQ